MKNWTQNIIVSGKLEIYIELPLKSTACILNKSWLNVGISYQKYGDE